MHVTSTPSAMSVPAAAATPSNWKRFLPAPVASLLKKLGASEQIAVVHLTGIIAASGGPGPQAALNLSTVGPQLERAFTTKNVKLVALVINCPGGSPTQSGLLGERIRMLSEKHEIPVVAVVEDLAASGGYWLACAADEIVAHRTSMVGSIGVISAGFGFEALIDKLGIERRIATAGENKARLDPFSAISEDDRAWMDKHLEALHRMFADWVRERRGDRLTSDTDVFTGDIWTGDEALDLGLIDHISTLHAVVQERFPDAKLVNIAPPVPLVARLLFGTRHLPSAPSISQMLRMAADVERASVDERFQLR